MLNNSGMSAGTDQHGPFITIDDCIQLAHELTDQLHKLGQLKYPLGVRRGRVRRAKRREVDSMSNNRISKQVKAGSRTYFFDIEMAKTDTNRKYLKITESRFVGEGQERERTMIVVFPEHASEFVEAMSEMAAKLS